MLCKIGIATIVFCCASLCVAQQKAAPQVKVNMINACQPSPEDKQAIASALALVPRQPKFGPDFEVDRGRSSMEEKPDFLQAVAGAELSGGSSTADWVRIRREFPQPSTFLTVQYSFSTDPKSMMVETLVFRVRDPKDLLEITIEDSASAVTSPAAMLSANTPASRVKLERFGKSSVALARCFDSSSGPPPDQSAYEPLFQNASAIVASYRGLLGAGHTVPDELSRISAPGLSKGKSSGQKNGHTKAASPQNP